MAQRDIPTSAETAQAAGELIRDAISGAWRPHITAEDWRNLQAYLLRSFRWLQGDGGEDYPAPLMLACGPHGLLRSITEETDPTTRETVIRLVSYSPVCGERVCSPETALVICMVAVAGGLVPPPDTVEVATRSPPQRDQLIAAAVAQFRSNNIGPEINVTEEDYAQLLRASFVIVENRDVIRKNMAASLNGRTH